MLSKIINPKLILSILLITLAFKSNSQINISLPFAKAVYQRNAGGVANIPISGTFSISPVSSIQAQLRLISDNSVALPWTTIESNPLGNVFQGQLNNVIAGWYLLEIRTIKSGVTVENTQLSHVGVGDVFLIAGQSNAQGIDGPSPISQSSNQVVTHNFIDSCSSVQPTFPNINFLSSSSNVGSHGIKAWLYGKLGDNLVTNQGVPVAFFNAAAGGSSARNWSQSSYGYPTLHPFYNANYCMYYNNTPINANNPTGIGSPYSIFKNSLLYYNSIFGIKAVLWHQGESESNVGYETSYYSYFNSIDSLIIKSRADFNFQIPWVISRVSYFLGNTNLNVINAQTDIGNNNSNKIFQGPNTDLITVSSRADSVHFNTTGLIEAANAWSTSLNSNFYLNATPASAQNRIQLTYTVNGSNLTISAPIGYSNYKWIRTDINGNNYTATTFSNSQNITVSSGTYRCYVQDTYGRFQISQDINSSNYLNAVSNTLSCNLSNYISDLKPFSITNNAGPIEYDKSFGGTADGDGNTQSIAGTTFTKGLGVHSNSVIEYKIPNSIFHLFTAKIGIDDEVGNAGSVQFKVYGDNNLLYTSAIKTGNSAIEEISINIFGYSILKLEVVDAGDGTTSDHANWADAKLICDNIPPTAPSQITLIEKSRKCISISWTASTDNVNVTGYRVFRDNVLVATLSGTTLNYQFTGLSQVTSYNLAVEAFDQTNNTSNRSSQIIQTYQFIPFTYSKVNFCPGEEVTPIIATSVSSFKYVTGPGGNLNLTNGTFSSNNQGQHTIRYYFGANTCLDSGSVNIVVRANPTITPSFTSNKLQIKEGESIILTATGCISPFTYLWDSGQIDSTLTLTPVDTTIYTVRCINTGSNKTIAGCLGPAANPIKVNVTPLCSSNLQLISTVNDISLTGISPIVNSSNTIQASNKISTNTIVNYKAGNSILLQPGFVANNGTSFVAQIEGCTN